MSLRNVRIEKDEKTKKDKIIVSDINFSNLVKDNKTPVRSRYFAFSTGVPVNTYGKDRSFV